MTNNNLRVLKTKRKLLDALVELKREDQKKITISKLIQRSHITRGTFYIHYHDCDDFFHAINIQIVEELFGACMVKDENGQEHFSILKAMLHIQNDHLVFETLLADQPDDCLYQCIEERLRHDIMKFIKVHDHTGQDPLLLELKATIFMGAIFNVIYDWLANGMIYNAAYLANVIEKALDQMVTDIGNTNWQMFYK